MKIEKYRNGYRIRKMVDGKSYCKTFSYRPTQKEAIQAMNDLIQKPYTDELGTFLDYAQKYLSNCEKSHRAPSTIANYESICRQISDEFMHKRFFDITQSDIIREVERYSVNHSDKSVSNYKGFIRSVFASYRPSLTFPRISTAKGHRAVQRTSYEPTTAEVLAILEAVKETRYSIPFQLACLGLRRGEVLALDLSDLNDNTLTINKALSVGPDRKYHQKATKTEASTRTIILPDQLADEIRSAGCIYSGNPHRLNERLHEVQDRLGIPRFNLHTLRHFAAAFLLKQGWSAESVRAWCGWEKGSQVMNRVYAYDLDGEKSKEGIAESFADLFQN